MKYFVLIVSFSFLLHGYSFGQRKKHKEFKQVQVEALGPGSLFSINYDFRITGSKSGFGFRAGIGGTPLGVLGKSCNDGVLLTIPFGFNVLSKGKLAQFEWGAGAVLPFVDATKVFCGDDFNYSFFSDATDVYYYAIAGVRLHRKENRFVYRIFISPLFQKGYTARFWGGAGVGVKL